jgi:hypothetical protein
MCHNFFWDPQPVFDEVSVFPSIKRAAIGSLFLSFIAICSLKFAHWTPPKGAAVTHD